MCQHIVYLLYQINRGMLTVMLMNVDVSGAHKWLILTHAHNHVHTATLQLLVSAEDSN